MARGWRFTALVGGALALTWAALGTTPAQAGRRAYRVKIDSRPSGATVYLDSKDGDPLGKTPYSGKIDSGIHTLIVELDGYVSSVQDVNIKRTHRLQRFSIRLSKVDLAVIHVVAGQGQGNIKGARILVDGEEMGNVPDRLKVPAGPHQVQVVKDHYKPFETWVEVTDGQELKVTAELVPTGGAVASSGGGSHDGAASDGGGDTGDGHGDRGDESRDSGDDHNGDHSGDETGRVEGGGAAHSTRAVPFISLGAGLELAGRRFRFQQSMTGRPYDAGGRPLLAVKVELVPGAASSNRLVSGWVLLGSYARATPFDSQVNNGTGGTVQKVPTRWSESDVAVGYRFRFSPDSYLGAQVGYGNHLFSFTFDSTTMNLKDEVPAVDYKFISMGADLRLGFAERMGLLLSGGTRLVSDTGALGKSVDKTAVTAYQVGAGLAVRVAHSIELRLTGRYENFSHAFTTSANDPLMAKSGTDQFFGGQLAAFYLF